MKAKVIEKILTNIYKCRPLPSMIHVIAAGKCYPLNPHDDEDTYDGFEVNEEENVLILDHGDDAYAWIDCDCVTSIEI